MPSPVTCPLCQTPCGLAKWLTDTILVATCMGCAAQITVMQTPDAAARARVESLPEIDANRMSSFPKLR